MELFSITVKKLSDKYLINCVGDYSLICTHFSDDTRYLTSVEKFGEIYEEKCNIYDLPQKLLYLKSGYKYKYKTDYPENLLYLNLSDYSDLEKVPPNLIYLQVFSCDHDCIPITLIYLSSIHIYKYNKNKCNYLFYLIICMDNIANLPYIIIYDSYGNPIPEKLRYIQFNK